MRISARVVGLAAALLAAAVGLAAGGGTGAPRIRRGPYLQPAEASAVTLAWYTDVPTEGLVEWREETGPWSQVREAGEARLRHEVVLRGLEEGVRYSYRILGSGAVMADLGTRTEFGFDGPPASSLKLVAFGDCGTGGVDQWNVARAVSREDPAPDMVLLTGDIVYPSGADPDYDPKFFAPYAPLLSRLPFYAAIGNHDYDTLEGRAYFDVFTLPSNGPPQLGPEAVYSFERARVHFVVHDSNATISRLKLFALPWHVSDVRGSTARFRIAALHHTPYSSATNSVKHPTPALREFFGPLFTATGIDLVLAGHDHVYERTRPIGGVVYITSGAGGAALYPRVSTNDYTAVFYGAGGRHSYTTLEASGRTLSLRQTDVAGCRVDSLALDKAVAEGDPWQVFKGSAPPPADWFAPEFQDRAWTTAAGALGYGSPDQMTTLPDMKGSYLTVYARSTFVLARAGEADDLMLRMRYDDGFVAYLNGVEVARRNVAVGQGPRTPASAPHSGDWFETVHLPPALLRAGSNVLAVEGHNARLEDPSFVLGPELTLLAAQPGRCP